MRVKSSDIVGSNIAKLICIIRPFINVSDSKRGVSERKKGWRVKSDTSKLNNSVKKTA